jgi:hypothetical protein
MRGGYDRPATRLARRSASESLDLMRRPPLPEVQGIDDMTGFKVPLRHLKKQWDGALTVEPDKRNPQDLIRPRPERNTVANPRPEGADVYLATNILLEDGLTPLIGEDGSAIMTEGPLGGEGL